MLCSNCNKIQTSFTSYANVLIRTLSTQGALYTKKKDYYAHEKLPVLEYSKINLSKRRMYVFGSMSQGAIGLNRLVKPLRHLEKKNSRPARQLFLTHKPVRHTFADQELVRDIVAGHGHTLFVTKQKKHNFPIMFGCGINKDSQIGYQSARLNAPLELLLSIVPISLPLSKDHNILAIGAGRAHSIVSVENLGLLTFGNNILGQCGRLPIDDEEYFGSKYIHIVPKFGSSPDYDVVSIASKYDLTVCVTRGGKVYTFGSNDQGQLGRGRMVLRNWEPGQVKGDLESESERVIKVATSGASTLAITDKGDLFCWGSNECGHVYPGKLCHNFYEPTFVPLNKSIGKIKNVAVGDSFSFILNDQGDVYTWGFGACLGLGPSNLSAEHPTIIPPPLFGRNEFNRNSEVLDIVCGFDYAAAINSVGDMFTWGKNINGCLGLGECEYQPFPLKVCLGGAVEKVSLGIDHTIVLTKGGF